MKRILFFTLILTTGASFSAIYDPSRGGLGPVKICPSGLMYCSVAQACTSAKQCALELLAAELEAQNGIQRPPVWHGPVVGSVTYEPIILPNN